MEGGGGGERETPISTEKNLQLSGYSSPNYSGALLKSATRQREREKKKGADGGREKCEEEGSRKSKGERLTSFCKQSVCKSVTPN